MDFELPEDVLHLMCSELRDRADLSTLFNCAVCSKRLAPIALSSLYRVRGQSPGNTIDDISINLADQIVEKWAIYWRSIIVSSFGKTVFPYHVYLRQLDLRDLENLFEENRFNSRIQKVFFAGDLKQFLFQTKVNYKKGSIMRLNGTAAVEAIGEVLTAKTPLVEEMSGKFKLEWVSRLPRIRRLEFYDGSLQTSSENSGEIISSHCSEFQELSMYTWSSSNADEKLAELIGGLPPQRLTNLTQISSCRSSTATCLALNNHSQTLNFLQLDIQDTDIASLTLLRPCTAIKCLRLKIEGRSNFELSEDTIGELSDWLGSCTSLKEVSMTNFKWAAAVLTPAVLNEAIALDELNINLSSKFSYFTEESKSFHFALRNQKALRSLELQGSVEDVSIEDVDVFVSTVSKLNHLTHLELKDIMVGFDEESIAELLLPLARLEEGYIGGMVVTDKSLNTIITLKNLKYLAIGALSRFTAPALLAFVEALGPKNEGLELIVDYADPDYLLTEAEIETVKDSFRNRIGGHFDYNPSREPGAHYWGNSSSDSD